VFKIDFVDFGLTHKTEITMAEKLTYIQEVALLRNTSEQIIKDFINNNPIHLKVFEGWVEGSTDNQVNTVNDNLGDGTLLRDSLLIYLEPPTSDKTKKIFMNFNKPDNTYNVWYIPLNEIHKIDDDKERQSSDSTSIHVHPQGDFFYKKLDETWAMESFENLDKAFIDGNILLEDGTPNGCSTKSLVFNKN
jgi:hypothetical protein